ncbi:helix-turn-helix domain-containing protein [Streptomyces longispororuber]|uniref:helix-turn-helix domain-containing protein n=1 Tax=Streptomyces longispororuber TaxID=68230 RepID=UPI0037033A23
MSTPTPMRRLVSGELLTLIMKRTGTGNPVTIRQLADAVGVSAGTISALRTGTQALIPEDKARRIAAAVGVDLDVLFIPCERAGRYFVPAAPQAVSA